MKIIEISDRVLTHAALILLTIVTCMTVCFAIITMLAVHRASESAERFLESRQAASMCRDALLQCTARREQIESLMQIAATGRIRNNSNIGGGP
jgi:biopolymer transport protein ExbB/TolQ